MAASERFSRTRFQRVLENLPNLGWRFVAVSKDGNCLLESLLRHEKVREVMGKPISDFLSILEPMGSTPIDFAKWALMDREKFAFRQILGQYLFENATKFAEFFIPDEKSGEGESCTFREHVVNVMRSGFFLGETEIEAIRCLVVSFMRGQHFAISVLSQNGEADKNGVPAPFHGVSVRHYPEREVRAAGYPGTEERPAGLGPEINDLRASMICSRAIGQNHVILLRTFEPGPDHYSLLRPNGSENAIGNGVCKRPEGSAVGLGHGTEVEPGWTKVAERSPPGQLRPAWRSQWKNALPSSYVGTARNIVSSSLGGKLPGAAGTSTPPEPVRKKGTDTTPPKPGPKLSPNSRPSSAPAPP